MAQTKSPTMDKQTGSAVSKYAAVFNKYRVDSDDNFRLTPKDFEEMRAKDGTFMALTNLLTLPILASSWDIENDELADPNGEQAEFVKLALTRPPEQGGMSTPFNLVISDMLRSTYEGWRGFEKVYTKSPDGKIVFRKIASYPSDTLHIDTDEKGGFDGFTQTIDDTPVKIPVEKCVLVTHGKERNWLKGESMLLAAATHYHEKHKFYQLGNLQAQAYAMPARVGIAAENSSTDQMDEAAQSLQEATDLNSAVILPFGYEIAEITASGKSEMIEFINHHDRQMALSILAQFLMLGSNSTGSFALSKDQTDLFNLVIKSIQTNLEYHINAFIIPDLTRYNFARPSFPQLKFADLTDATLGILQETFNQIISKKSEIITDEFANGIIDKMALQLGIDMDELREQSQQNKDDSSGTVEENSREKSASSGKKKHSSSNSDHEQRNFADPKWRRELTTAEQQVNFSNIENKLDTMESSLDDASAEIVDQISKEAGKYVTAALKDGDRQKALKYKVSNGLRDDYTAVLIKHMNDSYNYGKTSAAGEIKKQNIATPKESREYIDDYAASVVDKQCSDIEFEVRKAVMAGDSVELALGIIPTSISEIISLMFASIESWFTSAVPSGVSAIISSVLNRGRFDIFNRYREDIQMMQYSAILDSKVCATCEDLDGTTVTVSDWKRSVWQPPIHFYCRCIWVAVMQEAQLPPLTGFSSSYNGQTVPSLI